MTLPRDRLGGLLAVLGIDLVGVTTMGLLAVTAGKDAARTAADGRFPALASSTGTTADVRATLLAACALVGLLAWLLAVAAVAGAARGLAPRSARRWVWAGLVVNTVGSVAVAISAAIAVGPASGVFDADAEGQTSGWPVLVVALALCVGGAALSLAYLILLRVRPADVS